MMVSCQDDVMVSEAWDWKNGQWIVGDAKTMTIEATDTTAFYSMDIGVKHDKDYAFQNLYVKTTTVFPSGKEVTSVSSLELQGKTGYWAGDCGNSTCEVELPLQRQFTFPELGTYTWTIEPYMRVDTVKGIRQLSVECRTLAE